MSYNSKYTGQEVEELLDDASKIKKIMEMVGSHNKEIRMFCVEPVTVTVNGEDTVCNAGEYSTVFVGDAEFTITPTSNNSIKLLSSYPIPLTWYDWLEGVDMFSNIVFDMNELSTYMHWIQYYQNDYHVQKAQYSNCIFWSDKPYTHSPFEERTNYTLYYSAELPLCYSSIPENTYKPFYLAYGVKTDPNWNNINYINSYSMVSGATQTFSYYGASSIGIFDMAVHPITLPKDCRGLMYHAPQIQHAGVFDATNTTNFGAKKGSWQDAFGDCISLQSLYIQNLKTSINVSWSPINVESIEFIISNAINTSSITISLSPYTWYRLTDDIKTAATEKNINLELITTNYKDDSRLDNKKTVGVNLNNGTITFGNDNFEAMKPDVIYVQNTNDIATGVYIAEFQDTTDTYSEYSLIFKIMEYDDEGWTPTLTVPEFIKWANGVIPTLEYGTMYELNISRSKMPWGDEFNAILTPFKNA